MEKLYLSTYFLVNLDSKGVLEPLDNFIKLLKALSYEDNLENVLNIYSKFVVSLKNKDFCTYLKASLNNLSEDEVEIIKNISKLKYENIRAFLEEKFADYKDLLNKLPKFKSTSFEDFKPLNSRAFIFENDFELKPVEFIEKTKFCDLKGYKEQKRVLFENTKALLEGSRVNNILLYGDAGCGKSTSVRALLNEFSEIKIVQIFKDNLINLDKLYEKLRDLKDKFIIFADDISFDESDKTLSTMKAVLEGSIIQCPKNAVIYATSNRRHLVRESFQSRSGDEIHLNDTINEISSLSERFGINLLFSRPNQSEFIDIVLKLAQDNNIKLNCDELASRANKLALIKGQRSPRIARQLIDNILAGVNV